MHAELNSVLAKLCLLAVALFIGLGMGLRLGRADGKAQVDELRLSIATQNEAFAKARQAEYQRGVEVGSQQVNALHAELDAMRANQSDLQRRLTDAPILAAKRCVASHQAAVDQASMAPEPDDDRRSARLSYGAVVMWDAASFGVPLTAATGATADPCRSLDLASPACAVAAPVDVEDAWRNHITNAQSCAEDRARQTRLIQTLQQLGAVAAAPSTLGSDSP